MPAIVMVVSEAIPTPIEITYQSGVTIDAEGTHGDRPQTIEDIHEIMIFLETARSPALASLRYLIRQNGQ